MIKVGARAKILGREKSKFKSINERKSGIYWKQRGVKDSWKTKDVMWMEVNRPAAVIL